ncbi:MAG: alpha/beta fold hydrolase [Gemmatimonadetes bacterium]|nr:alpha/beta fold hydrolase [Gemmatimonadota bacterium]
MIRITPRAAAVAWRTLAFRRALVSEPALLTAAARVALALGLALLPAAARAQGAERDVWLRDFRFASGEHLDSLRMHVTTLGRPEKDARGQVKNAVLILHGTTGTGRAFLSRAFAGQLFGPGQPLDTARTFILLPDGIGHGKSSKPSDGLKGRFPHYDYADMVVAEQRLLKEGFGIGHVRLVIGTSMGCMHAWIIGTETPDYADALVPLACVPTQIAGRNRMWRTLAVDAIRSDPAWNHGDYAAQPPGLMQAMRVFVLVLGSPKSIQAAAPTRDAAEKYATDQITGRYQGMDANDFIWALESSRTYDPSAKLGRVTAKVLAINFSDDLVNPPELGLMEALMPNVRGARYVLWPITEETRGHGTHSLPAVWKSEFVKFMATLP